MFEYLLLGGLLIFIIVMMYLASKTPYWWGNWILKLKKIKLVNIIDFAAGGTVAYSLFRMNDNPIFWLIYGAACFIYMILSWKRGLYGMSLLNVSAVISSIRNYILLT